MKKLIYIITLGFLYNTVPAQDIKYTSGNDSWNADSALVATDVLLVPVGSLSGDVKRREHLIQRIEALRLFNPSLRVLVIELETISAFGDGATAGSSHARTFAQNVLNAMGGEFVGTSLIERAAVGFGQGRARTGYDDCFSHEPGFT